MRVQRRQLPRPQMVGEPGADVLGSTRAGPKPQEQHKVGVDRERNARQRTGLRQLPQMATKSVADVRGNTGEETTHYRQRQAGADGRESTQRPLAINTGQDPPIRQSQDLAWLTTLLLMLVVTSAVADLQTQLDEDSNRLVITPRKDGQNIEAGYVTLENPTGPSRVRSDSGFFADAPSLFATKIAHRRQRGASYCPTIDITSEDVTGQRTCLSHSRSHIYGGPEQYNQNWLTEHNVYSNYSYVSKQQDNMGVAERYWLFSDGRYLYVPPYVPLFIEQNTNKSKDQLCFIAENRQPYPVNLTEVTLRYTDCHFDNAREAHENAIAEYFDKPLDIPDERMTTHPIWSTWARYKRGINDAKVRQFASEIVEHGFSNSQIEIDDKWETCYGSLTFDPNKFPDVRALVDDLHSMGFRVTLWVHPFINSDCEPHYSRALQRGWFVTNTEGSTIISWWNGRGGIVDFTNATTAGEWSSQLWKIKTETGIDSFKFDAGETSWLPQPPVLRTDDMNPVQYTLDYLKIAAQFGPMVEARVGQQSQQFPIYIRMLDKDSRWGFDNGLASLVTTLLQMNMVGYPFVLPDMVGGNGYGSDVLTKELFIRWLQANVFMPAIQFSYVPWDFDGETVGLSRHLTALHARHAPRITDLMKKAVRDGSPVNPPVWWIAPTDDTALGINSEFLLGEDLLVAPVLEEGAASRDIYLPRGIWRDEADPKHPVIEGPVWLTNYSAPLTVLPYFTRLSDYSDLPDNGGSSQLRLFIPATACSWVTSTVVFYICLPTFHHLFT
ncbi:myogenesis-regulating glycosidase-like [Schistocerca gregaria]|uniref:myogenesis-regulating glycosidase-like n=1 Tax=Schistocerca gregaria TaxID=7010 RepID=UPI00211DB9B5|nr:myogenesis-regulating glycosidase-like [Schistocerca gregaria]